MVKILFGIIFLWTPPHFWPLAIDRIDEYKKEGVPMDEKVAAILLAIKPLFPTPQSTNLD